MATEIHRVAYRHNTPPFPKGVRGISFRNQQDPLSHAFPPFSHQKGGRGDSDSSSTRNTGIQPFHIA